MRILTGIDLPLGSPGGSVELLRDIYGGPDSLVPADTFMLDPADVTAIEKINSPVLLPVTGKAVSGDGFWSYVDRLTSALTHEFTAADYDVLHLQHLTFGATAALPRAFPAIPQIALVHGTDLLYATENRTQADVLRETAGSAAAIVVPTGAMADRLRQITPVAPERIVSIPWGVPDRLIAQPPERIQRRPGVLRVLYAGRLTAEKATSQIISAVAELDAIELAVAAPLAEFAALAERADLSGVRYLGWLSREALWQEFTQHDLLMVPSLKLEAFGLVTVEAQACGLPVAYQPVPGLIEVLGDSALAVDFGDIDSLSTRLGEFNASPARLDETAAAGFANSKRFPLSRTARELSELSRDVM
ncbi:glycosyltransferase family 4 protein [Streptomyces californicus]|uniref:glycosyltransferase family 4 protein n=1 Tax=Streptomyces californicus TaxID=67351 RepID=UPI00296F632B|nr:glycosyltransferase family 4 protein [Streptomyces californicus]MDW4901642.1 glycosyltransferase family 4 protein [Streptomyces californicus]